MFEKTIQKLQKTDQFSQDLQEMLHTNGLNARFANVQSINGFIFALLPNGAKSFCFAYLNVISHKDFKESGAPILHFCNCQNLQKELKSAHLIFKRKSKNAFDFSVWQGRAATGIFTDYELRICPLCLEIFAQFLDTFPHEQKELIFQNLRAQNEQDSQSYAQDCENSSDLDSENDDTEFRFSKQDLQNLLFSKTFDEILRVLDSQIPNSQ